MDHGPRILDLSYLIETADGDPDFVDEILSEFLLEMATRVGELESLLAHS